MIPCKNFSRLLLTTFSRPTWVRLPREKEVHRATGIISQAVNEWTIKTITVDGLI